MKQFDLHDFLEVFIITNGRSTFEYTLKAIQAQRNVKFGYTVIKDILWVDANNKILQDCKSKFFLRVDDDMILHPEALGYMYQKMLTAIEKIEPIYFIWKLWDTLQNKQKNGVKAYDWSKTKSIGFRTDYEYEKQRYGFIRGKIDKVFKIDAEKLFKNKKRQHFAKYPCVVGIHAFASLEEQLKYRKLIISHERSPEENGQQAEQIVSSARLF
ncbi:glycosyltransferase family A protein [Planctomycetota bacterium]